jgi:hypothetical protein
VTDGSGRLAFYIVAGGGSFLPVPMPKTLAPSVGAGVSVGGGTTSTVNAFGGPFHNASAGVGLGGKYTVDYYRDPADPSSHGGGITVGFGVGGGASAILTNTWVWELGSVPLFYDSLYDWLHPEDKQPAYDPTVRLDCPAGF